jgi:simple sugar transport system ATP-binding protein
VALMVLDEPTAVLTPQEVDDLFVTFKRMAQDGHALIFISHKLNEVLAISHRITVLRDGKIVGTQPNQNVTRVELANMMVGRPVLLQYDKPPVQPGAVRLNMEEVYVRGDRGKDAVNGVSLELRAGEILGLAGVSGNGQRELAESITGLRKLTGGKVLLERRDITGLPPAEITDRMLSYIPEERMRDGVIKDFSVAENLILREHGKRPYSRSGLLDLREVSRHADALIAQFHVKTPSRDTLAKNLSGGNIQKVVLAREIFRTPRVIIAAQPTRGLDIGATEYVREQLLEQRRKGVAVMLISEDLDEILALSDRIAVLYEGRVMDIIPRGDATPERLGLLMAGVRPEENAPVVK